ncbi:MAG TPA: class I SAM-dependent methyltransferase [Pirellulales bacterium]|nr:class I SAM-dependent methyltransferase [Pirellulales bacterium]
MKDAIFILGPEESGTQTITEAFVRGGYYGDFGLEQRMDNLAFDGLPDRIVFRRTLPHGHDWPDVGAIVAKLQERGYRVRPVVIWRDKEMAQLAQTEMHGRDPGTSRDNINLALERIYAGLAGQQLWPETVYLEAFVRYPHVRSEFFRRFELTPPADMQFPDPDEPYRLSRGRQHKYAWLPGWVTIHKESEIHPHIASERADLFDAFNGGTTELEVLNWLHSTIMALKPDAVLETGAADGVGTIALASACRNNGFGMVHSIELDEGRCQELERKLREAKLIEFVRIHHADSLSFLQRNKELVFDIGFYDSMCEIRAEEFRACLDHGTIRKLAVFHDTAPTRPEALDGWPPRAVHERYRATLQSFADDPRCAGFFESTFSRGFVWLVVRP